MSFMKKFIKDRKLDDSTFAAEQLKAPKFYIDTGSYSLNAAISGEMRTGGIASNGIIAFAGEQATGKTFYAVESVKNFLRDHPTGEVIYFESERAIKKGMLRNRGIDESKVYISEVVSVQEFRTRAVQLLEEYKAVPEKDRTPLLMVLDSLGNLSTSKELEDTADGKETKDMTRAAIIKAAFRVITLKAGQLDVPIIVTNHTYDSMGSMFPSKEMSGGSGLKYCASSIVFFGKRKEKDGDDVIGNVITARMFKSRETKENTKVETMLNYSTGLDRYYGLLELAEEAKVFNKVSTRFEVVDEDGVITKVYGKTIMSKPEKYFTEEVLDKIQDYINSTFKYGSDDNSDDNNDDSLESFESDDVE